MQFADGAVRRLGRIGRAHDIAIFQNGALAFQHLNHDGAGDHEIHQLAEKRPRLVHGVEGFGLLAGHADALLGDDAKPGLLDQRVDRAGQIARGRVGLDDRKGAFNRHDLYFLEKRLWELRRLYRRHRGTASDQTPCAELAPAGAKKRNYNNFTNMNPLCKQRPGLVHVVRHRLRSAGCPDVGPLTAALSPMAPRAPKPLRRRPCYANSRLLPLPRRRWQRRRWRRLQPPPGAATAGTVDGMAAAGAGTVRAFSSAVRPTPMADTAAALCGDWSRPPGDRAGAWSTAAIERNPNPGAAAPGFLRRIHLREPRPPSCNFHQQGMLLLISPQPFRPP